MGFVMIDDIAKPGSDAWLNLCIKMSSTCLGGLFYKRCVVSCMSFPLSDNSQNQLKMHTMNWMRN